jgi:hypothetical protein
MHETLNEKHVKNNMSNAPNDAVNRNGMGARVDSPDESIRMLIQFTANMKTSSEIKGNPGGFFFFGNPNAAYI